MTRVRTELQGAVGRVILARPEKKNALDLQMARELRTALETHGGNEQVHVIVLAADGADFCAGADLEALEGMIERGAAAHREDAEALAAVFTTIRRLPQPVIASVRGRALAGGAGLATACDIVIAAEGATFGYPEVRVGFVPAMVMTMLRRCAGEKRAFELVATGRTIDAREALEIGLVSRVVPDDLHERTVAETADHLARAPGEAVRATKRLFHDLDARPFDEALARGVEGNVEARGTESFRAGVRRFVRRER